TLAGWGGPNLLKSYEIERRQIGERNVGASRYATLGRRKWRAMWRPDIRKDSDAGAEARDKLAAVADVEQRKSNEMIGAELGYRYVDSPVICNVPGGPEHLFREYQPTPWPRARGCRTCGSPTARRCRTILPTATRSSSSAAPEPTRADCKACCAIAARRRR